MVTESIRTGLFLQQFAIDDAGRQSAARLLEKGEYDQLVELLQEAKTEAEQRNDAVLVNLLAATQQICLVCNRNEVAKRSYKQAYEEAVDRDEKLRRHLQVILVLLNKHRPAGISESDWQPFKVTAKTTFLDRGSEEWHTLWRRVQGLLGWERIEPVTEVAYAGSPATSAVSAMDKFEAPTIPSAEKKPFPVLVVYCLGDWRVYLNNRLVEDWNGLKGQMIFKYLVVNKGKPVAKDILMDLFWPDSDPEAARRNLHQAVYSLRQALRNGHPDFQHILFENDRYLLNPALATWIDYEEFLKCVQAGRRLEAAGQIAEAMAEYGNAESLYQGDYLEEDPYEEWTIRQREQVRGMYLDITDRLGEYYLQQRECAAAIALCQKLLARDSCHEGAHRRLMRCYASQNQRHLAVRQYQICREVLESELGLEPAEETVALYRQLIGNSQSPAY